MNQSQQVVTQKGTKVAKPAPQPVEAYGVKGMKSTPWRKTFRSADAMNAWTEKNDAEVFGMTFEVA